MSKFMLSDEHIGQKIYEIEEEKVVVIKTRIIAKDDNEAFQKYLDCNDTTNCENYDVKDNGSDVINFYTKDYPDHKGTREVGKVVKEYTIPDDEDYTIVEEYN
tara:strand:- start:117 stop:425 length:309 start_codon:yes stop_codon:yes gene_type:complete